VTGTSLQPGGCGESQRPGRLLYRIMRGIFSRLTSTEQGHFEFNNNSTPVQKVQLFYQMIQNDKIEKVSVFNTLRHFTKR
jgi:hypothetical protein